MNQVSAESENLKIIRRMIDDGQRNFREQSSYYLLWGWAVLIAALLQYLLIETGITPHHWVVWPILMSMTALISFFMGWRQERSKKHRSFIDQAMAYLWGGFFIYLLLVLFLGAQMGWAISYILIIGLYGFGTFVSGGILRFRPLIIGGIASLALALLCLLGLHSFAVFPNLLLLLALSICLSYLIPGYLLKWQKTD